MLAGYRSLETLSIEPWTLPSSASRHISSRGPDANRLMPTLSLALRFTGGELDCFIARTVGASIAETSAELRRRYLSQIVRRSSRRSLLTSVIATMKPRCFDQGLVGVCDTDLRATSRDLPRTRERRMHSAILRSSDGRLRPAFRSIWFVGGGVFAANAFSQRATRFVIRPAT